jgi:type I restriction enzyme S subunit
MSGAESSVSISDEAELPEGWAEVAIGEVCQVNPPKPKPSEVLMDAEVTFVPMPSVDADSGTIRNPLIRSFDEVRKGFTSFRENDVIMAKITPCMENGKAAIARELRNGLGFGSTEFHVLRSEKAILPEFVYYFVRQESFRSAAEMEMTGSVGQKRVPAEFIQQARIPLPPLAEQFRIVRRIAELTARVDASRERLDKVPAILKKFRQATLSAACSGNLTRDWREDHRDIETAPSLMQRILGERFAEWSLAEIARMKAGGRSGGDGRWKSRYVLPLDLTEADLPEIPSTWCWTPFDSFAASFQYGPRFGEDEYVNAGIPTVRTTDMDYKGNIKLSSPPQVLIKKELHDHFLLRDNDLLVTRTGATIGKCALFDRSIGSAIASAYLIRYRLVKSTTLPHYLLVLLMSPWGQMYLVGGATASAQPNVNTKAIARIPVPLPPLEEQVAIVTRTEALLNFADAIERRITAATTQSEKLTQSILARAFRGELISTEADLARSEGRDYEPASALLERIRSGEATTQGELFPTPPRRGRRKKG